jgi:hypothetical protein
VVSILMIGEFALVALTAMLVLRSLYRWREHSQRSRSGAPLIAEAVTGAIFFVYGTTSGNNIFAVASALVLASAILDYVALRISRRRTARRTLVRIRPWSKGPYTARPALMSSNLLSTR